MVPIPFDARPQTHEGNSGGKQPHDFEEVRVSFFSVVLIFKRLLKVNWCGPFNLEGRPMI